MFAQAHGQTPGTAVELVEGARTMLHRYELVGDVLVRRAVLERRALSERELRLVDVLVEERGGVRVIALVRGILLRETDLARLDDAGSPPMWREFTVCEAFVRAVEDDLGARRRGPSGLRLAAVDGVRLV